MHKLPLMMIVMSMLIGCTGMDKLLTSMSGLGTVTEHTSSFDGASVIEVTPNYIFAADAAWSISPIKLGARWDSTSDDYVTLTLQYSSISGSGVSYINFSGLVLNIDGVKHSYKTAGMTDLNNTGYTSGHTTYTSSENSVVIPYTVFKQMLAADDCRLRVLTLSGTVDAEFSVPRIPAGGTTAIVSLREFDDKVAQKIFDLKQHEAVFGSVP